MLCAKYSYKDDIAVKKQEAFEEGQMQKAIEAAITLVHKYKATPENAAKDMNAPLEEVLKALKIETAEA